MKPWTYICKTSKMFSLINQLAFDVNMLLFFLKITNVNVSLSILK